MSSHPTGQLAARPKFAPAGGGALCVSAPAKLNLDLLVGPRRDDGYHGLDSIIAKVTLYDQLLLRPRADERIDLECTGADCGPAERNLALRAARLLADQASRPVGGADIRLMKGIPPGSGLGGGSSDAAAVLDGLNELWGLHWPAQRLAELGAALGSDVPLFLGPPAARMTGRGEVLEAVSIHPFAAVLHLPNLRCPTADVYAAFDRMAGKGAAVPRPPLELLANTRPSHWRLRLRNDLAAPAMAVCPPLEPILARLAAATTLPVNVTGSGSALFILCDDAAEAAAVAGRLPPDLASRTLTLGPNGW